MHCWVLNIELLFWFKFKIVNTSCKSFSALWTYSLPPTVLYNRCRFCFLNSYSLFSLNFYSLPRSFFVYVFYCFLILCISFPLSPFKISFLIKIGSVIAVNRLWCKLSATGNEQGTSLKPVWYLYNKYVYNIVQVYWLQSWHRKIRKRNNN